MTKKIISQTGTNTQTFPLQSPLEFSTSNEIELNSLSYNSYSFSTGRLDTDNIPMSDLKQYVKYPMIYNEILRTISEQAYGTQGIYSNICDYMIAIPTLANITTMRNKTPELKELKKTQTAVTVEPVIKRLDKDRYSATVYALYYIAMFLEHEEDTSDYDFVFSYS